ncbi:hypothetical protein [Bacteroides salyersiae]|jgi:hypothetical protein|uniref:hypothetical protein n=1 Tax=Bacteroides salyersiae TaxID=291644 RepID=UPI00101C262A|nr:hypothetical protein [Bacteroides salyersiae]
MNSSLPIVPFLNSFFNIYHAYVIEVGALNGRVQGKIMYIDEETQEFVWYYSSFNEIPRAIQLLDILKKNEWLHNDKVIISKQDVVNYLKYMGWENVDINTTFLFLFSLKIKMVDDGKETDSFFIHF